jgi:predicted nucleic acid-binding protein
VSGFLDASALLRYLLSDDPTKAERVYNLLKRGSGFLVTPVTLAEVAWVLEGPNVGLPRAQVCLALQGLLQEATLDVHELSRARAAEAVQYCQNRSVSFEDAFLWAQAADLGSVVYTYDRRFLSADIQVLEP